MHDSDRTQPDRSLSEQLARLFGPEVEPHISLVPLGDHTPQTEQAEDLLLKHHASSRYEIRGELDRGGMGVVLEVWDRDLRRSLAMKVALADESSERLDDRRAARFLEEAQITAQLDHPGVVPVHELGVNGEGRIFFTMRRVRGRDLREILHCVHYRLNDWSETRALTVILRVCEAVAFAHSRGVIHRDLKPANVMVGEFGEVLVMDWGLARVLGREERAGTGGESGGSLNTVLGDERTRSPESNLVTLNGEVLGTPAYMAPEQAQGDVNRLSQRSDVYAIGAMLYHLLAHEAPYFPKGEETTQVDALKALRQGPPRPLAEVRPGIAAELEAICLKAMSFEASERYEDVQALANDLRAFLEQRVVSAYETGAWPEARKWVRRNRSLAAALGFAALALIVGMLTTTSQYLRAEDSSEAALFEARRADEEAQRARENERTARDETEKVLRLADAKRLEQLLQESDRLWPALPEQLGAMRSWSRRAHELLANLDVHRVTLDSIRKLALPYDTATQWLDQDTHPLAGELATSLQGVDTLIAGIDELGGEALIQAERRIVQLEERIAALEQEVTTRRSWRFELPELQWQHDLLADLVARLELLGEVDSPSNSLAKVEKRIAFANEIEERSVSGQHAAALWMEARDAVASTELYGGLVLNPQLGLLPLGPDPDSGLWEFAHLASGRAPIRGADGRLQIEEGSGVVLVLIPAGRFLMGCQAFDPGAPCFDPAAVADTANVHEVELSAFFIAKHEFTQAQWMRATGSNPSLYGPHHYSVGWNRARRPASLMHPVEQVSWLDCDRILSRLDLALPTEAQWEYAARAGTTTVFWTGDEVSSLQGAANLADRFVETSAGADLPAIEEQLDDGHTCHAPVGSFKANGFGLHDVCGNVYEWCGDGYGSYSAPAREGDGGRISIVANGHSRRGGGWSVLANEARSGARNLGAAGALTDVLGVRAARPLR